MYYRIFNYFFKNNYWKLTQKFTYFLVNFFLKIDRNVTKIIQSIYTQRDYKIGPFNMFKKKKSQTNFLSFRKSPFSIEIRQTEPIHINKSLNFSISNATFTLRSSKLLKSVNKSPV